MRGLIIGGTMSLLLAGAAVAQSATQSPTPPASAATTRIEAPAQRLPIDVRRTTIIVRDMELSLRLYRDALGLVINYDAPMNVSGPAFTQNGPPRPIRLVLLNANDPWIGWIGLIQYTDRPDRPRRRVPRELGPGSHIMVLSVADAASVCARAAAVPGVNMVVPPKVSEYPPRTPGGPPIRVLGCQFFDPDGAYLELNQAFPAGS
jgi:catechol 2,3-dioxygenase-like lactoylglutathione lyase family enzyme